MGTYIFKPVLQKMVDKPVRAAVKQKINPDFFSLAGIFFALLAAFCLIYSPLYPELLLLVPLFAFTRLFMNVFDGQVARGLQLQDPFGEVKNEFGDRLADGLFFLSFMFIPDMRLDILLLAYSAVLLLNYLGILSKAIGGERTYSGFMGKSDRMSVISVASILAYFLDQILVFNAMFALIAIAAWFSICIRLYTIKYQSYS